MDIGTGIFLGCFVIAWVALLSQSSCGLSIGYGSKKKDDKEVE